MSIKDDIDALERALERTARSTKESLKNIGIDLEEPEDIQRSGTFDCPSELEAIAARSKLESLDGIQAWGQGRQVVVGPEEMRPTIDHVCRENGWKIRWNKPFF